MLQLACAAVLPDVVKFLVEDRNCSVQSKSGANLLSLVITSAKGTVADKEQLAQYLITKGADVNIKDNGANNVRFLTCHS